MPRVGTQQRRSAYPVSAPEPLGSGRASAGTALRSACERDERRGQRHGRRRGSWRSRELERERGLADVHDLDRRTPGSGEATRQRQRGAAVRGRARASERARRRARLIASSTSAVSQLRAVIRRAPTRRAPEHQQPVHARRAGAPCREAGRRRPRVSATARTAPGAGHPAISASSCASTSKARSAR